MVCNAARRSIFLLTWAFRAVNKHDIVRTRPTFKSLQSRALCGVTNCFFGEVMKDVFTASLATFLLIEKRLPSLPLHPYSSSFSFSFSLLEHFNFCVVQVDLLRTLDVHNLKIQLKYGCRNLGIISSEILSQNPENPDDYEVEHTDTRTHTAKTVQIGCQISSLLVENL
jgi:hypothetical protein